MAWPFLRKSSNSSISCVAYCVISPYLCERCPGVLDGDPAPVVDGGPDGDGLTRDVASPVKPDPARDRALRQAGQADLVLDLAVEGLLQKKFVQIG